MSIFISHGGPGSLLKEEDKETIAYWKKLGKEFKAKYKGIICFSAHWYGGTRLNTMAEIIHDFGEFFPGIYDIGYSFKGPSQDQIASVLAGFKQYGIDVSAKERGVDHGIWIPFKFMFPDGSMPIIQIQMPETRDFDMYTRLGKAARQVGDDNNMLVLTSGGITHNLREAFKVLQGFAVAGEPEKPYTDFIEKVVSILNEFPNASGKEVMHKFLQLPEFSQCHPTPDHFLPLIVGHGSRNGGKVALENQEWSLGSLSLAAIRFS